eukprot:gene2946-4956_t
MLSIEIEKVDSEHSLSSEESTIPIIVDSNKNEEEESVFVQLVKTINQLERWQIIYLTVILLMIIIAGYILYEIVINRFLVTI